MMYPGQKFSGRQFFTEEKPKKKTNWIAPLIMILMIGVILVSITLLIIF